MNDEPVGQQAQQTGLTQEQTPGEQVQRIGFLQSVGGMFAELLEPGATFKRLKASSQKLWTFIGLTILVVAIFAATSTYVFTSRVPFEIRARAIIDATMKNASRFGAGDAQLQQIRDQIEQRVRQQQNLGQQLIGFGTTILILLILAAISAGLYLVGVIIMGSRISFKEALTVRVYADLPPTIVSSILLIILLYLKSPHEINPVNPKSAITSNLGPLVDQSQIALATIANNIDLFNIWTLMLAVIGLSTMSEKLSRGKAIGIVLTVWILGLVVKIGWGTFTGIPAP